MVPIIAKALITIVPKGSTLSVKEEMAYQLKSDSR
jgi:hypothetical protein